MVAKLITANSNIIHNNKYNIDDNNKTSATTEIARDADYVDFSVDDAHISTPLRNIWYDIKQTVLTNRKMAIQGHPMSPVLVPIDAPMLWSQDAQNIGLSNHKIKSALTCTVWSQCTPVLDGQTDRQTDGRTKITAIARRFVLTNASRTNDNKMKKKQKKKDEEEDEEAVEKKKKKKEKVNYKRAWLSQAFKADVATD